MKKGGSAISVRLSTISRSDADHGGLGRDPGAATCFVTVGGGGRASGPGVRSDRKVHLCRSTICPNGNSSLSMAGSGAKARVATPSDPLERGWSPGTRFRIHRIWRYGWSQRPSLPGRQHPGHGVHRRPPGELDQSLYDSDARRCDQYWHSTWRRVGPEAPVYLKPGDVMDLGVRALGRQR